jgi:hypothetical protein
MIAPTSIGTIKRADSGRPTERPASAMSAAGPEMAMSL